MTTLELKNSIRIVLNQLQKDQEANDFPLSAYFIKSLVRGDFILGKSDIDILLVFQNDVSYERQALFAKKLSDLIRDTFKNNLVIFGHYHDCDILYLCEKEIPKTETDFWNSPFSIFTTFGFDLETNHELIIGKDVLKSFTALEPTLFVDAQIIRLLKKNSEGNFDVVLISGQIIRLLLIKQGLRSLNKQEILTFLNNNANTELWLKNFAIKHFQYCYENERGRVNFESECGEFLAKVE